MLAESGNGLGFRHPLIRTALYEEMPVPVRAAWHRDAARALAAAGAPPERVARQLLRAADGSAPAEVVDERMLDWPSAPRTTWSDRHPASRLSSLPRRSTVRRSAPPIMTGS